MICLPSYEKKVNSNTTIQQQLGGHCVFFIMMKHLSPVDINKVESMGPWSRNSLTYTHTPTHLPPHARTHTHTCPCGPATLPQLEAQPVFYPYWSVLPVHLPSLQRCGLVHPDAFPSTDSATWCRKKQE